MRVVCESLVADHVVCLCYLSNAFINELREIKACDAMKNDPVN